MQLGLEAYRRFGGSEGEDKTAQAKREFHEAVAEYVKGDKAFKKAAKPKKKRRKKPIWSKNVRSGPSGTRKPKTEEAKAAARALALQRREARKADVTNKKHPAFWIRIFQSEGEKPYR